MTAPLRFADAREAADLAAFLARLLHYDRAAAVRLQARGGALAVFGRPPSFEVLAIRTAVLLDAAPLDVTVSAGELLDGIENGGETTPAGGIPVPGAVTGPPWAGVLPPHGGWREVPGLPGAAGLRGVVAAAVAEFRTRDEQLPTERRNRAERDRMGREIWSRTIGSTGLPLRAVHAAQSLGFLPPHEPPVALLGSGPWLRLRTPYGSVAVRTAGPAGLGVIPVPHTAGHAHSR
ncbi:hypothetical protein NX801_23635 [Streptomyces sp. LP05-1]|uniref:FAD-binding PCMH-type domain-containing protein n=1 Tax=Streptomyces pyxinae TaxID=2970734 RepID=A0ABT2CME3_9ACTN|nr:hypothetical protein [Streptomyces sp. LP05-1]MCS0638594.1 hypothetical protein [Streptomyces sp. LP05-1]